ncbi:hypothetical protein ACOME3_000348 [Neoechinorhynchus agilis]
MHEVISRLGRNEDIKNDIIRTIREFERSIILIITEQLAKMQNITNLFCDYLRMRDRIEMREEKEIIMEYLRKHVIRLIYKDTCDYIEEMTKLVSGLSQKPTLDCSICDQKILGVDLRRLSNH